MNKLLYITTINKEKDPGVFKKLQAQISSFRRLGFEVDFSFVDGRGFIFQSAESKQLVFNEISSKGGLCGRFSYPKSIKRLALKNDYSLVYIRKSFINHSFFKFLFLLKKSKPQTVVVLEIPTYPYYKELKGVIRKLFYFLEVFYGKVASNKIDLITYYGELQERIWGVASLRLSNGIDTNQIPFSDKPIKKNPNTLHLLAVANLSPWHGYDRLIRGIYNSSNEIRSILKVSIVGDGSERSNLEKLVVRLGLIDMVKFHGIKTGSDLDFLFQDADIGIGSLGLHRLGLTQGSTLKAREFLARGLPFVISYDDYAIPESRGFYLKFEPNDSDIDISKIINWWANVSFNSLCLRSFAVSDLSWDSQILKIVEKIKLL